MNFTHTLAGIALAIALSPTAALAHGSDEHSAKTAHATTAQETPFGRAGDPAKVTRTIRIDMSDAMRFTPTDLVVRRGETVRLVASNKGQILHEMVLGTPQKLREHAAMMKQSPTMEHEEAHMTHVEPGHSGEIVWLFDQAGEFQFACLLPGHFEAGMVGRVVVK